MIKMKTAICPGSFDPVTVGHVDIIHRAAKLFDKVIVVVMINYHKPNSYFTASERVELLKRSLGDIKNVEIDMYSGLLAEYADKKGACAVVKGLRAVSDFEYELQLAQMNRVIAPEIDTLFLTTNLKYAYLSSSMAKEVAMYGGDISEFLDPAVARKVREKYAGAGAAGKE